MQVIKKCWNKWVQKVDEHNSHLDGYIFAEEMWQPYEIFVPLIAGLICAALMFFVKFTVGKNLTTSGIIIFSSVIAVAYAIFLFLNWKAYSFKDK